MSFSVNIMLFFGIIIALLVLLKCFPNMWLNSDSNSISEGKCLDLGLSWFQLWISSLKKTVPAQADGWPHEDTGSPRSSGDIPTSLRHSEGTREEFEALKSSRRPAQNRLGTRPKIRPGGHDAGDAWCLRYSLLHQISAVQHQTVHPISAAVGKLQISSGSPPRNAESRAYHGRTQQTTRSEDLSGSCWVTNNHWDLSNKNMGIWKATFTIWLWLT